jgi:hypothetical protein
MLDRDQHGIIAAGRPADLLKDPPSPKLVEFLTRRTIHPV